jgi:hypothetical protein
VCSYRAVKWVDQITVKFDGTTKLRVAEEAVNDRETDDDNTMR